MKTIKIIDMTLPGGGQLRGSALTFREKLEIARLLDRIRVDAIELPPVESQEDILFNKTAASTVITELSAAVNVNDTDISATWESVRGANSSRLRVVAPVSTVQMEYTAHKKPAQMLKAVEETVKACRSLTESVEFAAMDATRAEPEFLQEVIEAAVAAGADQISVSDTAGVLLPDEFAEFIRTIRGYVGEKTTLIAEASDGMRMSAAAAAMAIYAGADGVKCTSEKCGYPTLEEMAAFVGVKGAEKQIAINLKTTELQRAVKQLSRMISTTRSEQSPFDTGVDTQLPGISLDENDELNEVIRAVRQLGYELTEEDNAKVYESFRRVAEKKHFVGARELDAIVASTALQVPSAYRIVNYVINSGNIITATANLTLERDGQTLRSVAVGDGPIDAAFLAIEQIIGHHYELDDFQIQTVTEGREAMGSALVKLRAEGRLYSGSGISTDIIGASIRAYVSALNKIVYEADAN